MLHLVPLGLFLILVVLHVYVNYPWVPDWAILLAEALMIPVFLNSPESFVIFGVTAILAYIGEWAGVNTNVWKYKKGGVPIWLSLAWAFTVVLIYYSAQSISLNNLIFIPLVILFSLVLDVHLGSIQMSPLSVLSSLLVLFLFKDNVALFVFTYLMGQFVEYFGAIFFRVWKYKKKISFLAVGFGYTILVWVTLTIAGVIIGTKGLSIFEIGALLFFVLGTSIEKFLHLKKS